jgi:hypothetical protein
MKLLLSVFCALTPFAPSALAQAAKRAWESAPAEKKALWQQQREALKHIDLH